MVKLPTCARSDSIHPRLLILDGVDFMHIFDKVPDNEGSKIPLEVAEAIMNG